MTRRLAVVVAVVVGLLGHAPSVFAHPLDLGYLRIAQSGDQVAVRLELDARAVATLLGQDAVDAELVGGAAVMLAEATYAAAPITTDDGPCRWAPATAVLRAETVEIASHASCPGDGLRSWRFPMLDDPRVAPRFQLLVKETIGGSERLTIVDRGGPAIVLGAATASSDVGFAGFVWSGVEHIGVAPDQWRARDGGLQLPDGIDHILFLIALMLGGGRLLQLVGITSGFTLGHSITLALAGLGVVRPPAAVIEPLIALSIALVAVEALTGRFRKHRWKLAAGFGLVHGFGFAGALTELDLSTRGMVTALFGYNLGVELGQVAVVIVVAPLVMLAHRHPRYGGYVVQACAGTIFVLGLYWFLQRTGLAG